MHELAELAHGSGLPALEVADEVPAERVAVAGVLGLEILRPVLADHLHAGLGQGGHVLDGDVLRGGHDGHPRADLLDRARRSRISSGDSGDHSLAPRDPAVAPVGEEEPGWQNVQRSVRSTSMTPASFSASSTARQRSSLRPRRPRRRSAPCTARSPRARPRSSTARSPARRRPRAALAECGDAVFDDAPRRPRQPTWRTASAGFAPFARAMATGRQSAVSSIIPWPGSSLHQPSQAS